MNYVVLICARGGSKGLPGKNLLPLSGTPLIGLSIKVAKQIKRVSRVVLSTDSHDIAQVAKEYGAEVPFIRPKYLAQDDSPEWLVWRHAIDYLEKYEDENIDAIVVLPVTAPLRSINDVNNCIDLFEKGHTDSVITVSESNRSPYFNMTVNDNSGYASLVIAPENQIIRRQDTPKVYDMTTVAYVVNADFVKENNGIFKGRVKSITVPQERAVDIDTLLDFKIAEYLLSSHVD